MAQYKTSDVASRCSNLIRVNVYKDSIKNAEKLPALPGRAALFSMLEPAYNALREPGSHNAHSTYNVTGGERQAAEEFLQASLFAKRTLSVALSVSVMRFGLYFKQGNDGN